MKAFLITFIICITTAASGELCIHGQSRLAGGNFSTIINEGRFEFCMDGEWKTACYYYWGSTNALVLCRQLGFPVDPPNTVVSRYDTSFDGVYEYIMLGFYCTGEEMNIMNCTHFIDFFCGPPVYVICPCNEATMRLTNGLIPQEGVVEVCVGGTWRGICGNSYWNYQDAFVVCRQLGYPTTRISTFNNAYFGKNLMPNITNLQCYGNESHLLNCSFTNTSCSPVYTAGVRCQGETTPAIPCFENVLQLSGGGDENEGRVELCSNGVWGTICGGNWDSNDALVVCRQLGFQNPRAFPYYSASRYFGTATGPILINGLNCDGSELSVKQCRSSSPVSCHHRSDVGVKCNDITETVIDISCTDGDVRLMDGETPREGRVEICINHIWGSVCDDSWDARDAAVVCSQLGFEADIPSAFTNAHFGESDGPYHLDNVNCYGDESTLLACSHNAIGYHNCMPGNDAGVSCNASNCHHGAVRLVNGATNYEGRLEVCIEGQWTTVCDDGFSSTSARTVCRQMFGENATAQYFSNARFGQAAGRIIMNVYCTGLESRLIDCPYDEFTMYTSVGCYHSEDISIRCYIDSNCNHGDVRLMDGDKEPEGRVEVCRNQVWGAIAYTGRWTFQEAKVVCTQIGYSSEWAVPLTTSFFGRGIAPILIYSIRCSGEETAVNDCSQRTLSPGSTSYYSNPVVGVVCQGNSTSEMKCTPGDIRLVGGQTETEGRVEVCVDGFWGTVCDEGWDEEDALVFCRQSGLSTAATPVTSGFFGKGSGPIISNLGCSSRESNISQCGWEIGTADCHHGRDVGVRCRDKQDYNIALATATTGPFPIGANVTLLCLVYPELPVSQDIEYTWTTSTSRLQPTASNRSFPNATLVIPPGHPRQGQYYCHVYRRQFLLGIGTGIIEVQGLVHITGKQNVQYSPPHSVTLSVKITPENIQYEFRALTWLHNGVQVIPSERMILSKSNATLIILNTTDADSGVYEVKFTGLLVRPYTRKCEQDILALLHHYPVGESAIFHLYTNTPDTNIQVPFQLSDDVKFETPSPLPFAVSENLSLSMSGMVHSLLIDESVSTHWFFNGAALRDAYGINIGPLKTPFLSIDQTIEIENANILDAGFYEVALTIDPVTHFVSHLQCPVEYSDFVTSILGIDPIVLSNDMIQLIQSQDGPENVTSRPSSDSVTVLAGGIAGGIVAMLLLLVIVITVCLIWQKRRSKRSAEVSAPHPTSKKSCDEPEKTESVRYVNTTEDVQLRPNISYEDVDYPNYPGEEVIYDEMN